MNLKHYLITQILYQLDNYELKSKKRITNSEKQIKTEKPVTTKNMHIAYKNSSCSQLQPNGPIIAETIMESDDTVSLNSKNHGDLISNVQSQYDDDHPKLLVLHSLWQLQTSFTPVSSQTPNLSPLLLAQVCTSLGHPKPKDYTVLIDSEASSIVSYRIAKNFD